MNKFLATAALLMTAPALHGEELVPVLQDLAKELSQTAVLEVEPVSATAAVSASVQENSEEASLPLNELSELEKMALGGDPVEIETAPGHTDQTLQTFNIFKFDFTRPVIDLRLIIETGKLPWEIPTLIEPRFTDQDIARFDLSDDDYVIVLNVNGDTRFYPLRILNWHKGVNDVVGGENVFVMWDPLSGNATAFKRDMHGVTYRFGDSGLVYRSSSLFFDEQTQSLWLPTIGRAVTGERSRSRLRKLPVVLTFFKEAKKKYPDATVMDFEIPNNDGANYDKNPFGNYGRSKNLLYPVAYGNDSMPRKEPVVGLTLRRKDKTVHAAISLNALFSNPSAGKLEFNFETGKHPNSPKIPIDIELAEPTGAIKVTSVPEVQIDVEYSYWFSWVAHHPKTYVIYQLP